MNVLFFMMMAEYDDMVMKAFLYLIKFMFTLEIEFKNICRIIYFVSISNNLHYMKCHQISNKSSYLNLHYLSFHYLCLNNNCIICICYYF